MIFKLWICCLFMGQRTASTGFPASRHNKKPPFPQQRVLATPTGCSRTLCLIICWVILAVWVPMGSAELRRLSVALSHSPSGSRASWNWRAKTCSSSSCLCLRDRREEGASWTYQEMKMKRRRKRRRYWYFIGFKRGFLYLFHYLEMTLNHTAVPTS